MPQPHPSAITRWLLLGAGWLCIGLALVGIPLPLLPTTPFLLLAAACFTRSSPRLHHWMLENRQFGPLLAQWQTERSIPAYAKRRAFILIAGTFGLSIVLLDRPALQLLLAGLGLGLLLMLSRLSTTPKLHHHRVS